MAQRLGAEQNHGCEDVRIDGKAIAFDERCGGGGGGEDEEIMEEADGFPCLSDLTTCHLCNIVGKLGWRLA